MIKDEINERKLRLEARIERLQEIIKKMRREKMKNYTQR